MESKPSCVNCRKEVEDRMGVKTHQPIVVNVYTGNVGNGPEGAEAKTETKNANMNMTGLIQNAGYPTSAPADATGMASDINNAKVKEMADDYLKELNNPPEIAAAVDKSGDKLMENSDSGLSAFTNGNGMFGGFKPRTIYPSMSYEIVGPAQKELDEMNNL